MVKYIGNCDIVKPYKTLDLGQNITSDELEVKFIGFSKNNSQVKLSIYDTVNQEYNNVTVGL